MFEDLTRPDPPALDVFSHPSERDDDRLERWIALALRSAARTDDETLAIAAKACREIYAAYNQTQREHGWYRRACVEAKERETKLREVLVTLLESLGGGDTPIDVPALPDDPDTGEGPVTSFPAQESCGGAKGARENHERSLGGLLNPSGTSAPCPPHGDLDWWLPAQPGKPGIAAYVLRPFSVFVNDRPVSEVGNRRSTSVLKFLLLNRARPVAREVLWNTFWPDATQEAARNNLNVAVCALRKTLTHAQASGSPIVFRNGQYGISDELAVWVDVEAFDSHLDSGMTLERAGDPRGAATQFRAAAALYHADLLDDDRYEDWLTPVRQRYRDRHLELLRRLSRLYFDDGDYGSCAAIASRLLACEPCEEEAHRMLMRCHARMRHIHLALRQFHICVDVLSEQLNVAPSVQTVELLRQIKSRQPV